MAQEILEEPEPEVVVDTLLDILLVNILVQQLNLETT